MTRTPADRSYDREHDVALGAVRDAAILCRSVQGSIDLPTLYKEDRSPVTIADLGSQALICRTLEEAFPDDPVVAEEDSSALGPRGATELPSLVLRHVRGIRAEAGADDLYHWIDRGRAPGGPTGRFWTLDPIDGTKGFLRGGQYAVALALIVDGRVEVAALACPNLPAPAGDGNGVPGSLFAAVRGLGATQRPLDCGSPATPVHVSDRDDPRTARLCESVESGHSAHGLAALIAQQLGTSAAPVRMDSQAKYAAVSRGEADVYLRLPVRGDYREKIWDHAAGALILEEAGGAVTDLAGQALDFTRGRELLANRGIVATNRRLQERVLAVIAEAARASTLTDG